MCNKSPKFGFSKPVVPYYNKNMHFFLKIFQQTEKNIESDIIKNFWCKKIIFFSKINHKGLGKNLL